LSAGRRGAGSLKRPALLLGTANQKEYIPAMTTNTSYDNTSHRTWNVQGGIYTTDDSGGGIYTTDDSGATHNHFIIAQNTAEWGPNNEPAFMVLGHYSSESLPPAAEDALHADRFAEWLQEEAVALAEKQNLVPADTVLCITCNAFFSCILVGGKQHND